MGIGPRTTTGLALSMPFESPITGSGLWGRCLKSLPDEGLTLAGVRGRQCCWGAEVRSGDFAAPRGIRPVARGEDRESLGDNRRCVCPVCCAPGG